MKFAGLLSRPERLRIFLSPAAVEVAASSGERDALRLPVESSGDSTWAPSLACLGQWARQRKATARADIVISNHWVRYAVLPAGRGRLSAQEETGLAATLFGECGGGDWPEGEIRIAPGLPEEGVVAAGIEKALTGAIEAALALTPVRCCGMRPLLSWHLDRARVGRRPPRFIVVCLEPRRMVAGLHGADGWEWLRSSICGGDPAPTIERELLREQSLRGGDLRLPLYLFTRGALEGFSIDPSLGVDLQRLH